MDHRSAAPTRSSSLGGVHGGSNFLDPKIGRRATTVREEAFTTGAMVAVFLSRPAFSSVANACSRLDAPLLAPSLLTRSITLSSPLRSAKRARRAALAAARSPSRFCARASRSL